MKEEISSPVNTTRELWDQTSSPSPLTEEKKRLVSKDLCSVLTWHIWTIISCVATGVLLLFNFSQYVIGTEIGKNTEETSNILRVLQLAAKAHEITIISSLVNVGRQMIQWCLIGDGTLLGILGMENALSSLTLLISEEFTAALKYSASILRVWEKRSQEERRRGRATLRLIAFIFIACLLCTVSGPASAVLMIPQNSWYHEMDQPGLEQPASFPNILIDTRLGYSPLSNRIDYFEYVTDYWQKVLTSKEQYQNHQTSDTSESHHFYERGEPATANTTVSWDRPLVLDADWKGATTHSTIMWDSASMVSGSLYEYKPLQKNRGSRVRFSVDVTGIESSTVCRRRRKQSCSGDGSTIVNGSDWCYMAVTRDSSEGLLLSNQDLLYVADHLEDRTNGILPRFWMTEGPRISSNNRFTDSILFVFEDLELLYPDPESQIIPTITVCSVSATLKAATAVSENQLFSADQAEFDTHLHYFNGSSTTISDARPLLYHENWLDLIHAPDNYTNLTYPNRNISTPTENTSLKTWATHLLSSSNAFTESVWGYGQTTTPYEAGLVEIVVGGAFISVLRQISPSSSQYPPIYNVMDIAEPQMYPPELMLEPIRNYSTYINPPVSVYRLVYRFNLSVTSVLAIVVLIVHAIIALLGSVWQLRSGGVIQAWQSTSEYAKLCLGSDVPAMGAVRDVSAGMSGGDVLNNIVRIREISGENLGLVVATPDAPVDITPLDSREVDLRKRYGLFRSDTGI